MKFEARKRFYAENVSKRYELNDKERCYLGHLTI